MDSCDSHDMDMDSSEGLKRVAESSRLNSKNKQKMNSSDSSTIHVNLSESSRGEVELSQLNSRNKEKMDYDIDMDSFEGSKREAESSRLNSKRKQKMYSSDTSTIPVNLSEGSRRDVELSQLNSKNKEKIDSCDSDDIDMDSSEGSKREEESSRLNSKNKQMQNAKSARGRLVVLMELLNQQPANIDFSLPRLRVPSHRKQLNADAYKPCSISIGPVHHGQPELLPMEAFKRRYASNFTARFSIKIEELIRCAEKWEVGLRNNYGMNSQEIPSDEFVRIMCIDAAFLAGFLLEEALPGPFDEKWNTIISDLFLLENQIPFDYLSEIVALIKKPTVLELCDNFLDNIRPFGIGRCRNMPCGKENHLLDMLRTRMAYETNENGAPEVRRDLCPTISQLHQAGIEFYPNIKSHELTFQHGILKIPPFTLDHNTGTYFANLLASELFADDRYSTDHIAIMECLIKGQQDVQILVERNILENFLKDDIAAVSLIKEIGRSINVSRGFPYKPLVKVLNEHCGKFRASPWSMYLWKWKTNYLEWKRELTTNYFGTPWKTLSVIAAVILLALTAAQTVFSYFQLKGS